MEAAEMFNLPPTHQCPQELPPYWAEQLPSFQHDWIRKTLFRAHPTTGKPELVAPLRLWWYPPQAPALDTQPPSSPDVFFSRPLFLWMPLKMWAIPLACVQPACRSYRLTESGLYRTVRKVLNIDGWYDLATEYLECKRCKKKYVGWSEDILQQLDVGHRCQFPALLTYRYSCDKRVVRMLRERSLGNSVSQLYKKLNELHSEAWSERALLYLSTCERFVSADILERPIFSEPPPLPAIPKPKWLLSMRYRDVVLRMDEVKAKITSVFGSILMMNSTWKVTRKLAGAARNTATCCTNVSNEYGQVLCSVLTVGEGECLQPMAAGLMKRYREAEVAPPTIMYVDRDCCSPHGQSKVKVMFSEWTKLHVRLDIWHFMRRIAAGVTSETHQLYEVFMALLSRCIFEWDPKDVAALRLAKQKALLASGMGRVSDEALDERISSKELELHCRRRTRRVEETTRLIKALIDQMDGEGGKDTRGVPLLDHKRIQQIWLDQQRHIPCIQDPPDSSLYIKTGTLKKSGVMLCTYRCVRDSSSHKTFHLHLNCFISGTSASHVHNQAYFLEGLMRWNEDRMKEAGKKESNFWSHSSTHKEALNRLSNKVLGKSLDPSDHPPGVYTGEKFGIEYLYSQTGKAMPKLASPEEEDRMVELVMDEQLEEYEEGRTFCPFFVEGSTEDMTVPVLFDPPVSTPAQSNSFLAEPSSPSQAESVAVLPWPLPDVEASTQLASESNDVNQPSTPVIGQRKLLQQENEVKEESSVFGQDVCKVELTSVPCTPLPTPVISQTKLLQQENEVKEEFSVYQQDVCTEELTSVSCTPLPSPVISQTKLLQQENEVKEESSVFEQDVCKVELTSVPCTPLLPPLVNLEQTPCGPDERTPSPTPQRKNLKQQPKRHPPSATAVRPITAARPVPVPAQLLPVPVLQTLPALVLVPVGGSSASGILTSTGTPSTSLLPTSAKPSFSWPFNLQQSVALSPAPLSAAPLAAPRTLIPVPNFPIPRSTKSNRKRRAKEIANGAEKRSYVRELAYNICSKCGLPKSKYFGHSRYNGVSFCAQTSQGKTAEQWLAEQRRKAKEPAP